jgi:peptide/nickel transport system ATP-binding protein
LIIHQGYKKKEAWAKAIEVLTKVGIATPEKRMKEYPHQLSGGMRQRVMIAMAVSCAPKLLIADEPTTALDVTIQAQILELMLELRQNMNTAIILITHDMGVVAETADNILVLYAGKVVEYGSVKDIFNDPKHPYTQGLLSSIPPLDEDVDELNTIEGTVPAPGQMPAGCRFSPRCPYAKERCAKEQPKMYQCGNAQVSCFKYEGDQ